MAALDRRTFIIGAAGIAGAGGFLAACGDDSAPVATNTPSTLEPLATPILVPAAPDGLRSVSPYVHSREHRLAYALTDGNDVMRRNAPDSIQLEVRDSLGNVVTSSEAIRRDVGVPTPYYSIFVTPPAAGLYSTVFTNEAGNTTHEFVVLEPEGTRIPQPGDQLPPIATATLDDARGVDPVCTRLEPCPFHDTNLVDALAAADKPTILSIATPGFCRTAICGPVIDLLIQAAADRDDLHIVHAEVFIDPQNQSESIAAGGGDLTEIVAAYELPHEPVLYVADANGIILRRLDAIYDQSELDEALALV